MKEFLISVLNFLGFACWIEIVTQGPQCTYYFGPFLSTTEAEAACQGYLEDLKQEGSVVVSVRMDRFKPHVLTIYDESFDRLPMPLFSRLSADWQS